MIILKKPDKIKNTMPPKIQVRVRIAPSPTGYLHIGTARTALFNWLFAKKHKGVFIVRIEDTDKERSKPEYEKDILEQLKWLGFNWDEFYRQSERGEIYEKYIKKLLDERHAYYCFCTKEELEAERQSMLTNGHAPKYSGKCRTLEASEVKKKLKSGAEKVIRFKMPETKISFTDIVRGKVSFDMSLVGDIVVAKDVSSPLYNLAAAIDDYEMKTSHAIRAEDHLANTPKQIAMQKALGLPSPEYAHLPLILNPDRSKMSKRFEATAVSEYRNAGYFPDALVNFLALLGWHSKEDREIFTREELIKEFELERVQKGGAAFNIEKMDWINGQYLKKLPDSELYETLKGMNALPNKTDKEAALKIILTVRDRMKKLSDFKNLAGLFFEVTDYDAKMLLWKDSSKEDVLENLKELDKILGKFEEKNFTKEKLMELLNPIAESRGRGEVFWPLRVALSGKEASPGPFEIMEALGKTESLKRIRVAVKKLM